MPLMKSFSVRLWVLPLVAMLLTAAPVVAQQASDDPVQPQLLERGISSVDWEKVRKDAAQSGLFGAVPASGNGAVGFSDLERVGDATSVPVMLPKSLVRRSRLGLLEKPIRLSLKENRYSASCRTQARSYLIQGTRVVFSAQNNAEIPPTLNEDLAQAMRAALVDRTDYGVELSYELYGVAYSVGVFCSDLTQDAACQDDGFVRQLASEMSLSQ
ncbi:MAG: hypothetical protein MRY63_09930 [Neomegalonema sp.]|nr:hypothetical protein [Neomegalonema sp.]